MKYKFKVGDEIVRVTSVGNRLPGVVTAIWRGIDVNWCSTVLRDTSGKYIKMQYSEDEISLLRKSFKISKCSKPNKTEDTMIWNQKK